METKEVVEKSKALQKATAAGEPPTSILSILNELKAGVVPSEDLLRSTKIGVVVNRSKQHKNSEVARLASEIVKKWRDDIHKQKGSSPGPSKRIPVTTPTSSASPAPSGAEKPKFTVPPDQRNYKKDQVDIARTSQSTRNNCIGLIYNGLCHLSTVAPVTILNCAASIEHAAFAALGPETNESYKAKMRSLFQNLKNKSNPTLRVRVLNGDITPERFITMTHEELKSAERRAEDEKLASENMREAMVPQAERSISTSLQCSKCGQRKVSYSQAQTRSADEPMTTFCECTACGKRWKVSYFHTLGVWWTVEGFFPDYWKPRHGITNLKPIIVLLSPARPCRPQTGFTGSCIPHANFCPFVLFRFTLKVIPKSQFSSPSAFSLSLIITPSPVFTLSIVHPPVFSSPSIFPPTLGTVHHHVRESFKGHYQRMVPRFFLPSERFGLAWPWGFFVLNGAGSADGMGGRGGMGRIRRHLTDSKSNAYSSKKKPMEKKKFSKNFSFPPFTLLIHSPFFFSFPAPAPCVCVRQQPIISFLPLPDFSLPLPLPLTTRNCNSQLPLHRWGGGESQEPRPGGGVTH